jgi:SAM-dependent methyltransferase
VPQDSSRPDFWDIRYREGVTPWDAAGVPPRLSAWLAERPRGQRVLVPGCGSGYELRLFAERGDEVLAIDFADAALEAAQRALGPLAHLARKADFFALGEERFDVIYERAFLCALPRRVWPRWAGQVARLLVPGGVLAGFFYFDDNARGPPFGIAPDTLEALLAGFALSEDRAVPPGESLPIFRGKERWQVWRRPL